MMVNINTIISGNSVSSVATAAQSFASVALTTHFTPYLPYLASASSLFWLSLLALRCRYCVPNLRRRCATSKSPGDPKKSPARTRGSKIKRSVQCTSPSGRICDISRIQLDYRVMRICCAEMGQKKKGAARAPLSIPIFPAIRSDSEPWRHRCAAGWDSPRSYPAVQHPGRSATDNADW